jgi:hypothetical protein
MRDIAGMPVEDLALALAYNDARQCRRDAADGRSGTPKAPITQQACGGFSAPWQRCAFRL